MTVEVTQAVSRNDADEIAVGPFMDRYLDGSSFSDDRRELTQAFARHRLASIEAACRGKDAEIEQARDDAATFCIQSLASMLGNPDYAQADGSEEWEGDVSGTLYNVLAAAGVLSEDDHSFVTLTERDRLRAKLDEANEIIAALLDIKHGDEKEKARAFLASAPEPEPVQKLHELPDEASIKHMVDRFLGWRLPTDFSPDGGIIFSRTSGGHANVPTGTNLFTATQAEAMVRYMLEADHDR